ncbi:hypothetical protein NQ318_021580 [Aromia moschata]|uniref:Tudor domain-containing protein n=1 Tax=Aromia moschata TaxID=1265417 RepID=A0AAV8YIP1_9CUCU|nr:hypothetical protein NQ318_021580 [Aromia moschata]
MSKEGVDELELVLEPFTVEPYLPDSLVKDELYEVKIYNVFDPSKFWLTTKIKELTIFMNYLKQFYDKADNRKTVTRSKIKKGILCIVRRTDTYYRCIIQPVLLPDDDKVRVFMIDFGLISNVDVCEVFHIFKKHAKVPRFAIRACLANILPRDPSKAWSQTDLKSFCALIEERQLIAKTCEIDIKRSILFVEIRTFCGAVCNSVNDTLIELKVARYIEPDDDFEVCTETMSNYKSKVKYKHLFPTFEAIEGGIVPYSLWEHDLLKNAVPLDLLYKNYYRYENNSDVDGTT